MSRFSMSQFRRLDDMVAAMHVEIDTLDAAVAAKDAEIEKLREALTFYSKIDNWIAVETKGLIEAGPFKGHYQALDNSSPAEADGGNRARAVLGENAE